MLNHKKHRGDDVIRTSIRICACFLLGVIGAATSTEATSAGAATADLPDSVLASVRPESIRANMRYLSSDLMEGRGTGTRGHALAAEFMASRFEAMGLAPAGDSGSYLQQVSLQSVTVEQAVSSIKLDRGGKTESLKFGEDYILYGDPGRDDSTIKAPVVFVGFGISAPDQNYDDYRGVDARGKIIAYLYGAPPFQSAVKAHYSASWLKRQNAAAHGAVGIIVLHDSRLDALYPFEKQVRDLAFPRFNWLDAAGKPDHYYPQIQVNATLSTPAVKQLLAGSGHSFEEIDSAARTGKLTSFPLPVTAEVHTVDQRATIQSPNVVAKLEGGDPKLKSEYVVYTAHLDHLGIGAPVKGDNLYNGALDNASGSAEVLEIARAFSELKSRPRRSILFLAVTAEESGLLGSDYFASNPTVPIRSIVANINIDEDVMLWPLKDVVALGAEHSTLESVVQRAAARMKLASSPDPVPEQVAFIRSDQYSFVRQGVPSLALTAGFKSDDPNIKPEHRFDEWDHTKYHQPQDDMSQPGLNFESAAAFTRVGLLCGWYVAQATARPQWKPGDFFGTVFAPKRPGA